MSLNNQVFLHGRLARDPELRQTKTDKAVCRFTVATDEGKTQSGEKITDLTLFQEYRRMRNQEVYGNKKAIAVPLKISSGIKNISKLFRIRLTVSAPRTNHSGKQE